MTTPPATAATNGLDASLDSYAQALDTLNGDPKKLLHTLFARDRVDAELRQGARADYESSADHEYVRRQLATLMKLMRQFEPKHPSYEDALLFEYRLNDILNQIGRYGDTETLRAERARVVDQLNRLSLAALGVPFSQLAAETSAQTDAAEDLPSAQLVALDMRLRKLTFRQSQALADMPHWRSSYSPPETAWWWRLDLQFAASEQERDLPWYLGAALCTMVSLTLSVEIIRRLWSGAPDIIAVFGTVLTLLLTGGPLFERRTELGQWIFKRIPRLSLRYRGEATFTVAALAMFVVLLGWFSLPGLGTIYNNWGYSAIKTGNLVAAEQWFARATALNPELPVPYYNLAHVYEQSGAPEEAIAWFRKAISYDRQFRSSYYRLGAIYNWQGEYAQAERVLLAGLDIANPRESQTDTAINDYLLFSNLGWTLFAQGRYIQAETTLQDAIQSEPNLPAEERRALAHYYLARVACQLGSPDGVTQAIQDTLRFVDTGPRGQLWTTTANAYLAGVKAGASPCATLPIVDAP